MAVIQTARRSVFARNTHAVRRDKNQGGLHSTEQQKQSMETLRETSWKNTGVIKMPDIVRYNCSW